MIIKIKADRTQDLWKVLPLDPQHDRAGVPLIGRRDLIFIVFKEDISTTFLGERYLCFWGIGPTGDIGCFEFRQRNYENLRDFEHGKVQEHRY